MFEWDPVKDKHYFRGMFQSHLMENKIAAQMGFENKREVYDELMRRAEAIQRMTDRGLTHYDDVFDLLGLYYSSDFDTFSAAIDTWVSITER
jgi:flagellar protein FlaI